MATPKTDNDGLTGYEAQPISTAAGLALDEANAALAVLSTADPSPEVSAWFGITYERIGPADPRLRCNTADSRNAVGFDGGLDQRTRTSIALLDILSAQYLAAVAEPGQQPRGWDAPWHEFITAVCIPENPRSDRPLAWLAHVELELEAGVRPTAATHQFHREHTRSAPRGQHFDLDTLDVKSRMREPARLRPRWCRGELEHASQRVRGRGSR